MNRHNFTLPTLTIPDDAWDETGPEGYEHTRLTGPTLWINDTPHHVEAYEMTVIKDEQREHPNGYGETHEIYSALAGEGPWLTIEVRNRTYAVIIAPHCD